MPYIFNPQDICPICQAAYAYDHRPIAITTRCDHIYHYSCIDRCEKKPENNTQNIPCPYCRTHTTFSLVEPPIAILAGVFVKIEAFSSLRDAILALRIAKLDNLSNLYKALFIREQFDWLKFTLTLNIDHTKFNISTLNNIIYEMLYASMASAYQLEAYKEGMFQTIIRERVLSTFNHLNYSTILSTLPAGSAEFILALTEAQQTSSYEKEKTFEKIIAELAGQPMGNIISWINTIRNLPNLNPDAVPIFDELLKHISHIQTTEETALHYGDIDGSSELTALAEHYPLGYAAQRRGIEAHNHSYFEGSCVALKTWIVLFVFCGIILFCSETAQKGLVILTTLPFHVAQYFYPTPHGRLDEFPGMIFGITVMLMMFWMFMCIFLPPYLMTRTTTTLKVINIIGKRFFPRFKSFSTTQIYCITNSLQDQLTRLLRGAKQKRGNTTNPAGTDITEIV